MQMHDVRVVQTLLLELILPAMVTEHRTCLLPETTGRDRHQIRGIRLRNHDPVTRVQGVFNRVETLGRGFVVGEGTQQFRDDDVHTAYTNGGGGGGGILFMARSGTCRRDRDHTLTHVTFNDAYAIVGGRLRNELGKTMTQGTHGVGILFNGNDFHGHLIDRTGDQRRRN